ncbi:MAG: type IV pilin-like G/H family protein [Coleofasciculaceae cyanobacterium]
MSQILCNLRHRSPLFVSGQLIAQGVLLAFLTTVEMPVHAQTHAVLSEVQAQNTGETEAVIQKLLGQWTAKDPASDQEIKFIFAEDGVLFLVVPSDDGTPVALKVSYRIDPTTQPMQLDIQLKPEEVALTIFEITEDDQLRLELNAVEPGLPRPTEFQESAVLLDKTSASTVVPEGIEVIDVAELEDETSQAKTYMSALTQVQQAYYLEQGKFAREFEQISVGLRDETELYRYQILPQGDNTESVMMTATAKDAELPSYTSAVFVTTNTEGEKTTIAQICETEEPSTTPPAMPSLPTDSSSTIRCPEGSRPLQM